LHQPLQAVYNDYFIFIWLCKLLPFINGNRPEINFIQGSVSELRCPLYLKSLLALYCKIIHFATGR
jgi:hypothetical protein